MRVALVVTLAMLAGCGSSSKETKETAPTRTHKKSGAPLDNPVVGQAPQTQPSGLPSSGIAECDDLYNLLLTCYKSQMPAQDYSQIESAFRQAMASFQQTTDPTSREQLRQACLQQRPQMAQAFPNCGF